MVSAILLAAGESRRMGERNKLLLSYSSGPLIRHMAETLLASDAGEVVVVLGHEAERIRSVLADLPVRFALNPHYARGMTTSIQAGVHAADPASQGFMICLSDLPLITPADYNRLLDAFSNALQHDVEAIVMPVYRRQRGNPVLFSATYRRAILLEEDPTGCRELVHRHAEHRLPVEMPDDHCLVDVDTPEAYERLPGR